MTQAGPLESDTCRDYVLPRLRVAGWDIDNQVIEQFPITDGRIIPHGKKHRPEKPLRADYVLEYRPGVPVAVLEAKREYTIPGQSLQQAKRYGDLLDIPFRFATNGKGIVEDDRDTGLERDDLVGFPTAFAPPRMINTTIPLTVAAKQQPRRGRFGRTVHARSCSA